MRIPTATAVFSLSPVSKLSLVLALSTLVAACAGDPLVVEDSDRIVIDGAVDNRTEQPIPDDVRLLVVWVVTAGSPDYTYVFGEGELKDGGAGFRVELAEAPPSAATNNDQLGVGLVLLTSNQEIQPGDDVASLAPEEILGLAGWHAIVYINGDPAAVASAVSWAGAFTTGYGVGSGVEVQNDFDRFEPLGAGAVQLIVDDLANIPIVNWT